MATHTTGSTAAHPPRWSLVLRVAAARAFLTVVSSLMLWALAPVLLGWQPHLILTGSMMPRIAPGDVIVTRDVDPSSLRKGQVVTVVDPDHDDGRTRTHRIVRIDEEGRLVLRGDANEADDSSPVPVDEVIGVGAIRVPSVGRPLLWLGQGDFVPLGVFLTLLAWSTATVLRGMPRSGEPSDDGDDEDRDSGDGPSPDAAEPFRHAPTPSAHRRKVLVGVAGMTVAVVVAGASPASAKFAQVTANPTSSFLAAASYASAYEDLVRADNPFLYWRLEETSGTLTADSSGNNRRGDIQGTPTFGVTGALPSQPASKAFRLTGSQRVTAQDSVSAPNVFSIEAWIRTTATGGGPVVTFGNRGGSQDSTNRDRVVYVGSDGRVYFGVGGNRAVASSTSVVNDGSWHHVVATYGAAGGSGMRLYVDGVLQGQNTNNLQNLTGHWRVGGDQLSGWTANPTSNWFTGDVDEVAIYTTGLSAAQVAAHYAAR